MNELWFFVCVFFYLGCVLLLYKLFGKNGLFAFSIFGTLLGNIAVCKCVDLFGASTTCGNVLYASTFLISDILSEKYGKKEATKAVKYSFSIMLIWLRNNGSTLISQAIDTVLFTTLAFWGTYPLDVFISILVTTYVFKSVVALFDTPFIYIARKIKPMSEKTAG